MSPRRKLAAALAIFLIAGGATSAALAAHGHSRTSTAPKLVEGKTLLVAAAAYLGVPTATLKRELRPGHPLAAIVLTIPGRSVAGLEGALAHDALANLHEHHDDAGVPAGNAYAKSWVRKRVAGVVAGTCPLELGASFLKLGGSCPGMRL
jgi:hypothetical protein